MKELNTTTQCVSDWHFVMQYFQCRTSTSGFSWVILNKLIPRLILKYFALYDFITDLKQMFRCHEKRRIRHLREIFHIKPTGSTFPYRYTFSCDVRRLCANHLLRELNSAVVLPHQHVVFSYLWDANRHIGIAKTQLNKEAVN